MRDLVRLSEYSKSDVENIFRIADELQRGKYKDFLKGKTIVMFFPESSIRTRVTFEKGIYLLGGQTILFPPKTLDKKEKIEDVVGYLNNWADGLIVRYGDISVIDEIKKYSKFPIINAMTDINHPCEMLADMYGLSKIRADFTKDNFLFVGASGNIGLAWKEASELMGFKLSQSCPVGYEIQGVNHIKNLKEAIKEKDIICTDSLSDDKLEDFGEYQVTLELMKSANENAILNPCPPFYRGEEVSAEAINSDYFVGYSFKKYLLEIQQAIIIYSILN
ncbi:peptide transporter [Clostridium sp.]|uniref:ornithine carbamoyltransferase n=1 Tax=Clostridium sp. TaxID=1506 RepID=UPI0026075EA7|nr:peptide transporter [Clostridium sp.]